jgi:DNA-binding NarL/FixJ family response regulator
VSAHQAEQETTTTEEQIAVLEAVVEGLKQLK